MIKVLDIERFKGFPQVSVSFRKLTLLAGENATGKSSVIQAFLLLKQSHVHDDQLRSLILNGGWAKVGTALDAVYSESDERSILFRLRTDDVENSVEFVFSYPKGQANVHVLKREGKTGPAPEFLRAGWTHLAAERLGPRALYPMDYRVSDYPSVGQQGEYTAHCLALFGEDRINNEGLIHPASKGLGSLLIQTRMWMQSIVPGVDLKVLPIGEADQVRIEMKVGEKARRYLRPTNVGFGISYTLPIVVGALMAKSGSLMFVENPEAHLHPKGQSAIGRFLALAANSGVQMVVETHSDHLLNGVRLAVKHGDVPATDVSIQFFARGEGETTPEILTLIVDTEGRIGDWPRGFFDQLEQDLVELY